MPGSFSPTPCGRLFCGEPSPRWPRDLPEKLEQTIFCELDKPQRSLYDELKEHYRQSLLGQIDREGLGKSKLQVLEALLRLRQAACHPGLLNKSRIDDPSAKLDTLLPRLAELADEGHKTIVFSQFTSFLSIARKKLDEQGAVYEYLDGKTRDRQESRRIASRPTKTASCFSSASKPAASA